MEINITQCENCQAVYKSSLKACPRCNTPSSPEILKLKKNKKKYSREEHDAQVDLVKRCHELAYLRFELGYIYAIPNGGQRDPRVARMMVAEGVSKGVPDLCLPVPKKGSHGLYIEMKSKDGDLKPTQECWRDYLIGQGYRHIVCRSADEAFNAIWDYLNEPRWEVGSEDQERIQAV